GRRRGAGPHGRNPPDGVVPSAGADGTRCRVAQTAPCRVRGFGVRAVLADRGGLSLRLDGLGVLQGPGRLLLARHLVARDPGDQHHARHGRRLHRGRLLRRLGHHRVLARGDQHGHRHGLRDGHLPHLRHAWRLCPGALHSPLPVLDPRGRALLPRHARGDAGVGLPLPLLRVEHLGLPADGDPRARGAEPALHALDDVLVLPRHPARPRRIRAGGRLHAVPGLPARHRAGDVAGGDHDGAVLVPAGLQRLLGHRAGAERAEPDHDPQDQQLSGPDPSRGERDVRRRGRGLGHDPDLPAGDVFPALPRIRPDGGRGEGL
ncbi:MAG: Maltodextrin ABC transporter, permease protein MdxG, partial [uncultured Rubellimicrobium sp.]